MTQNFMNKLQPVETSKSTEKPGFFKRMISKMDSAMKAKADAQAKNSECCSGNDKGKGGKCC